MAVPHAGEVDIFSASRLDFVDHDSEQIDAPRIHIFEKQVKCHRVIDVISHIGFEYDGNRPG